MKELKEVYTLQGSWGYFGMTSAMFRRCEEMSKRGILATSLTVDFFDKIYDFEQKARDDNRVYKDVILRNPYLDMAKIADNWLNAVGEIYLDYFYLLIMINQIVALNIINQTDV